jgi:hypothetical protein
VDRYRTKEWRAFREEIIRLDEGCCARCGRSMTDGAILHVHHKSYIRGREPWEYPYAACESLCQSCHAQEHGIIPPKTGWELIGYDDLGDLVGCCDYCGTAIRYVFLLQHEKWMALEVGEFCCDALTASTYASSFMHSRRRYLDRRKRFACSSRWVMGSRGILQLRQHGINVAVIPTNTQYKLKMNGHLGRLVFASALEAKMKAFDVIESGKVFRYLKKVPFLNVTR